MTRKEELIRKTGLGGGIGLQNSLLYELIDFNFLHFGNTSVWMPVAIMVMAVLEIPVFLVLNNYFGYSVLCYGL